jgi:hypothetical protein
MLNKRIKTLYTTGSLKKYDVDVFIDDKCVNVKDFI